MEQFKFHFNLLLSALLPTNYRLSSIGSKLGIDDIDGKIKLNSSFKVQTVGELFNLLDLLKSLYK